VANPHQSGLDSNLEVDWIEAARLAAAASSDPADGLRRDPRPC
jgi:hypothetical protein